jgi:glycerate kinase
VRVLVAFDKFKDSLTAVEACTLAVRALRSRHPGWTLDSCPLTDGGDGFADILTAAAHGSSLAFPVTGPRSENLSAGIGLVLPSQLPASARSFLQLPESATAAAGPIAIIEMASASGLRLLPSGKRNPWETTSRGTGQLIRAAAALDSAGILLGVGGSATNDIGLGALSALGFEFLDSEGVNLRIPVPSQFDRIKFIRGKRLPSIPPIRIACDVTNPLLGPNGATTVFGPQKGLRREDQAQMETAIARIACMLGDYCDQPPNLLASPGSGAAGGLPYGLMAGLNARLVSGFDLVSAWLDLDNRIASADIVITGEGSFDMSSLTGKGPGGVVARAHALGKEAHVFAGRLGEGLPDGFGPLHAITPPGYAEDKALLSASEFLVKSIEGVF